MRNTGFLLLELLVSIAIISFLIIPLTLFLMRHNTISEFMKPTQIAAGDPSYSNLDSEYHFKTKYINSRAGVKSCDLFMSNLLESARSKGWKSGDTLSVQINELNPILHERNVPTSINIKDQYVYIGVNSASTTDSDLLIFKFDMASSSPLELQSEIFLGPGVIDLEIFKNDIYLAERSLLTPLWKGVFSSTTFSAVSSSSIKYSLPKRILTNGEVIFVGTEKNINEEVYVLSKGGETLSSIEVGAGVNAIDFNDKSYFIASPKDPEIEYRNLHGTTTGHYDAEGSSGNGKSIFAYFNHIILGRTIGNDEIIFLTDKDSELLETKSINPNKSITQVMPLLNGSFTLAVSNNEEYSILIYEGTKLIARIPTSAVVKDIGCSPTELFAVEESTTTPLLYITSRIQ